VRFGHIYSYLLISIFSWRRFLPILNRDCVAGFQPAERAKFRRLRIGNPRHENRLALNLFNIHARILPGASTTRKTEKTREKMSFFPRAPRVFLPNRPVLGPFLAVKLLRIPQVVLCERVARLEIQAAIAENGTEPLIPWEQAKAGLDID
jgi:hypothetical protein